jgi:hypothetical protein
MVDIVGLPAYGLSRIQHPGDAVAVGELSRYEVERGLSEKPRLQLLFSPRDGRLFCRVFPAKPNDWPEVGFPWYTTANLTDVDGRIFYGR